MSQHTVNESHQLNLEYASIKEAIDILSKYLDKPNAFLGMKYVDDYSENQKLHVVWPRPETEQERDKRLQHEKTLKEYRRQQYEALKKEFDVSEKSR